MNILEKLEKLEYSEEWLEFGILNNELLDSQIADHMETGHSSTEHYRYGAFLKWVQEQTNPSRPQIDSYIHLAKADPDPLMGESALIDLLKATWLNNDDFEYVANKIDNGSDWFAKEKLKASLLRDVSNERLTDNVFSKLVEEGNSSIHYKLLDHPDMNKQRMELLAKHGAGKKIRNIAKERTNTRKLWET